MATKSDIKQSLLDFCEDILSTETALSSPYDYCGLLNNRGEGVLPYIGFELTGSPNSKGFGDDIYVDHLTYNSSGVIDGVVYRRETTLTVEFGVLGERSSTVDDLYTALSDEMDALRREKGLSALHDDVEGINPRGFSQGSSDIDVHDERLTYEITYARYRTNNDVTALTDINATIEVDETVTPSSDDI